MASVFHPSRPAGSLMGSYQAGLQRSDTSWEEELLEGGQAQCCPRRVPRSTAAAAAAALKHTEYFNKHRRCDFRAAD